MTKEQESETQSNAVTAMTASRQIIPGDVVNKATADLPNAQRSAIRRWHTYYVENAMTLKEAGTLIGVSDATASLIFRGKYEAKLDGVVSEIERFFELHDKRSQGRKLQFIPTTLTKKIWDVCDLAVEFQRIAFIFGDQQIGKSEALVAYKEAHNHGNTIYLEVPTGGALTHFITKLAEIFKISSQTRKADLRRRIIESFDDRMLLIVDEAHRCIPDGGKSHLPIQTVEFIREIFNERKCGVVLCATNVFRDAMEKGSVEKILRQTKRRRLCALQLPNSPTQEDLNTFAGAYGLPPSKGQARELEAKMIDAEALGMWLMLLRMASKLAAKRKQTMDWSHVLSAHDGLMKLEGKL